MVLTLTQARESFANTLSENPQRAVLQYFTTTFSGANYDNAYRTKSGADVWVNAVYQPIKASNPQYLPQGQDTEADMKFYLHGSVALNEDTKIGLGSPTAAGSTFAISEGGIEDWRIAEGVVYRKAFIKGLEGGSFYNEY